MMTKYSPIHRKNAHGASVDERTYRKEIANALQENDAHFDRILKMHTPPC